MNALTETFNNNLLNQISNVVTTGIMTVAGSTLGSANSVTVNGVAATRYSDGPFVRSGVTVTNGDNTFTATATDALGRSASTSVSVNLPGAAAFQYDLNGNLLSDGLRTFDYDDDHDSRSDGQEKGN